MIQIEDLSVYENIAFPLKYQKISSKEIKRRVLDVMGELGLTDKKNYYPEELSGGQQQRVAIARTLIKQAEIVIADEPTGLWMKYYEKMNQRGITLIIATHDKNISDICDRTLFLKDGIVEEI